MKFMVQLNNNYFLNVVNPNSDFGEIIYFSPGSAYEAEQQEKINTGLWTRHKNLFLKYLYWTWNRLKTNKKENTKGRKEYVFFVEQATNKGIARYLDSLIYRDRK